MRWERFAKEKTSWEDAQRKDKLELEQIKMFRDSIEPMFDSLVSKMKPYIESGRWGVILGDDRGGRLPALAMREIMSRETTDKGNPAPETFFVAAGVSREGEEYEENLKRRIDEIKEYIGDKRVLLVTDHIDTGASMRRLTDLLQEKGIAFDLMSLSRLDTYANSASPEKRRIMNVGTFLPEDSKFFVGKDNSDDGIIFWIRMRSAFMADGKKRDDVGLGSPDSSAVSTRDFDADPAFLASARELNKEMADRLYEKYFKKDKNN